MSNKIHCVPVEFVEIINGVFSKSFIAYLKKIQNVENNGDGIIKQYLGYLCALKTLRLDLKKNININFESYELALDRSSSNKGFIAVIINYINNASEHLTGISSLDFLNVNCLSRKQDFIEQVGNSRALSGIDNQQALCRNQYCMRIIQPNLSSSTEYKLVVLPVCENYSDFSVLIPNYRETFGSYLLRLITSAKGMEYDLSKIEKISSDHSTEFAYDFLLVCNISSGYVERKHMFKNRVCQLKYRTIIKI